MAICRCVFLHLHHLFEASLQDSHHPLGVTCNTDELCLHAFDSARKLERWDSIWEVLSQAASYIQVLTEKQLAIDYQTSDVRAQTILIRATGTRLWATAFVSQSLICPTLDCEWSLWWVDKGPYRLLCSRWMASHMSSERVILTGGPSIHYQPTREISAPKQ